MATSKEKLEEYMVAMDTETTEIATFIREQIQKGIQNGISLEELQTTIEPRLVALDAVGHNPPATP